MRPPLCELSLYKNYVKFSLILVGDRFYVRPLYSAVNGIVMSMTSTDIIKHLSGQEAYQW